MAYYAREAVRTVMYVARLIVEGVPLGIGFGIGYKLMAMVL